MNGPIRRILTVGGATQDFIIQYENPETWQRINQQGIQPYVVLEEGQKIEVTQWGVYSGGGATNAAACFQRLQFDVSVFCKLGDDPAGHAIRSELAALGVNVDLVIHSKTMGTGSAIVLPSFKGDRTVLAYRGANQSIQAEECPFQAIQAHDLIYITSLSGQSALHFPNWVNEAKRWNRWVAVNPGSSQFKSGLDVFKVALKDVHILILNDQEAPILFNALEGKHHSFSVSAFFKAVRALGPRWVVVTHGSEGVSVVDHQNLYFHPSLNTTVLNTLGAGDAFGATFVGSLSRGCSVTDAIRRAIINSASVIGYPDAKTGLLTESEIQSRLQTLPVSLLHEKSFS